MPKDISKRKYYLEYKKEFQNKSVVDLFNSYPKEIREKLLFIRALIFKISLTTEGVGVLEETVKWGEPAYLTNQTKSGVTIRLGWKPSAPSRYAIYFNCKTTLASTYQKIFGNELKFEGNRGIWFNINDEIPIKTLSFCIALALTYHLHKK